MDYQGKLLYMFIVLHPIKTQPSLEKYHIFPPKTSSILVVELIVSYSQDKFSRKKLPRGVGYFVLGHTVDAKGD